MTLDRLGRAFRSIHTRLLLVIIVSGLVILILLQAALFAHRRILAEAFQSSVAQYAQYLIKDLGSPPDYNRAAEVAGHTGMIIHYSSPEAGWSTSGRAPWSHIERNLRWQVTGSIRAGEFRGHHYFIYEVDSDHRFLFEIVGGPDKDRRLVWVGLFFLFSVTLLLSGSFLWIRRIMAPLRPLSRGVRQVGAGRLDHRVSVNCRDELGELASAFNWMAERLQHLIRSKDQILLDVSHELRSPLTRMRIALEMSPDGPLRESLAEDIREMDRMVTTILASARMQSGNLTLNCQSVDLISLIREATRPLEDQPPGVCLQEGPESVETFLDPEKVKTVLRNVVGNAIKYSRGTSSPVAISVRMGLESYTVEIQDEGIGIPEQDLPFVFEPFYRVDRSRSRESGGFGLGLSLCKAIMEAHHGSISIQSTIGKGTTVQLQFPCK
ncbi:MAG: HAMP domain-containing sensor histidine kinase [Syntrophobacteraceae bacterium]|jgi:signal transduction histidine kinase